MSERVFILGRKHFHFLFVYRKEIFCGSEINVREMGLGMEEFRVSSSGKVARVCSNRVWNELDFSAKPGMSLLVAVHTLASLSQDRWMMYSINYMPPNRNMNVFWKMTLGYLLISGLSVLPSR